MGAFASAFAVTMRGQILTESWRHFSKSGGCEPMQGKIADARALLAPIYDWFTEGFDAPDLVDAKTLLDELH